MTDSRDPKSATRYHATWVLPVTSRPIHPGWVEVRDGVITGFGPRGDTSGDTGGPSARAGEAAGRVVDLPGHIVLPALVNAHTHLELSGLRTRVPPAETMPGWARQVMKSIADHPPDDSSIRTAVGEARASGTGLLGDISNTGASTGVLANSGAPAVVFSELLGFDVRDGFDVVRRALDTARARIAEHPGTGDVRPGLAAHAPYSVSPALFRAIRQALDDEPWMPVSVHLAESREELTFLETGGGAWRSVLEERGRWDPTWTPHPGGAVAYLDDVGWLTSRTLVVHGVQLGDQELDQLAQADATLVTCPRSNQWTGAGLPPVDRFYASGVRVALGTDSLASAPDLNLFREMAEVRRLAPDVAASAILSSATRVGAEALGFLDFGSIEVGGRAALIAVRCPETLDDVEEYLLTGIDFEQVAELDSQDTH